MSGWNTIKLIRHLEQEVGKLGFKFAGPKHGDWQEECNSVSLVPKDESALPIYTREAQLFKGSIEDLRVWLQGVRWAREYDMMLKLSDDVKRGKAEQKEKNRQLMRTIKEGRRVEGIAE